MDARNKFTEGHVEKEVHKRDMYMELVLTSPWSEARDEREVKRST